jgi:osmoprotectant transport system substrate-binding protein
VWCAVLVLLCSWPAHAAVVVSSKLSSESAMLGQMIRLLLNAQGIATVDRTEDRRHPVVRKAPLSGEVDLVESPARAGFFFNRTADRASKDLEHGYLLGARPTEANHAVAHAGLRQCLGA